MGEEQTQSGEGCRLKASLAVLLGGISYYSRLCSEQKRCTHTSGVWPVPAHLPEKLERCPCETDEGPRGLLAPRDRDSPGTGATGENPMACTSVPRHAGPSSTEQPLGEHMLRALTSQRTGRACAHGSQVRGDPGGANTPGHAENTWRLVIMGGGDHSGQ